MTTRYTQSSPSLHWGQPNIQWRTCVLLRCPLVAEEVSTQRMLSQLVPNYSPSTHFHNTEQGSLYCFNNDSHAQKLFWLTSCIHHQFASVTEGHLIFCTINLLWKVFDALKVDFGWDFILLVSNLDIWRGCMFKRCIEQIFMSLLVKSQTPLISSVWWRWIL